MSSPAITVQQLYGFKYSGVGYPNLLRGINLDNTTFSIVSKTDPLIEVSVVVGTPTAATNGTLIYPVTLNLNHGTSSSTSSGGTASFVLRATKPGVGYNDFTFQVQFVDKTGAPTLLTSPVGKTCQINGSFLISDSDLFNMSSRDGILEFNQSAYNAIRVSQKQWRIWPATAGIYYATIRTTSSNGSTATHTSNGVNVTFSTVSNTVTTVSGSLNATFGKGVIHEVIYSGTLPTNLNLGTLPQGLTLSKIGYKYFITGIPTVTGTYNAGGITITIAADPPVILYPPSSLEVIKTLPFSYTFINTIPVEYPYPVTWTASGLPPGLTMSNTGTLSGTTTTTQNSYQITVTASGGGGSTSLNIPLTVSTYPPVFVDPPSSIKITRDLPFSYNLNDIVSSTYNYSITWAATGLPSGLTINSTTGVISGTTTAAVQNYPGTITATGGGGSTSQNITFEVTLFNNLTCLHFNDFGRNQVYDAANLTRTIVNQGGKILKNSKIFTNSTGSAAFFPNSKTENYEPVYIKVLTNAPYGTFLSGDQNVGLALPAPDAPELNLLDDDFVLEAWVQLIDYPAGDGVSNSYPIYSSGSISYRSFFFAIGATKIFCYGNNDNNTPIISIPYKLNLNTWTHVAVKRVENVFKILVNGTVIGTSNYTSAIFAEASYYIGGDAPSLINNSDNIPTTGQTHFPGFKGYMQGFRLTKHYDLYPLTTGNVIPTTKLSPGSLTSYLPSRSPRTSYYGISSSVYHNVGLSSLEISDNTEVRKSWIQLPLVDFPSLTNIKVTIEGWFKLEPNLNWTNSGPTGGRFILQTIKEWDDEYSYGAWAVHVENDLDVFVYDGSGTQRFSGFKVPAFHEWFYFSLTVATDTGLQNQTAYVHINGKLVKTITNWTSGGVTPGGTQVLRLMGDIVDGRQYLDMYNYKFSVGIARYGPNNYTPPTNTESNVLDEFTYYFIDGSKNANDLFVAKPETGGFVTSPALPQTPERPWLELAGGPKVIINWEPVSEADSYLVDLSTDYDFQSYTAIWNGGSYGAAIQNYPVTGTRLEVSVNAVGVTYYARVRSVNSLGTSDYSPFGGISPYNYYIPVNVVLNSTTSFTASWPDMRTFGQWMGSPPEGPYFITVSTNSDFSNPVSGWDNKQLGDSTTFVSNTSVTGLAENTTYYVRVLYLIAVGSNFIKTSYSAGLTSLAKKSAFPIPREQVSSASLAVTTSQHNAVSLDNYITTLTDLNWYTPSPINSSIVLSTNSAGSIHTIINSASYACIIKQPNGSTIIKYLNSGQFVTLISNGSTWETLVEGANTQDSYYNWLHSYWGLPPKAMGDVYNATLNKLRGVTSLQNSESIILNLGLGDISLSTGNWKDNSSHNHPTVSKHNFNFRGTTAALGSGTQPTVSNNVGKFGGSLFLSGVGEKIILPEIDLFSADFTLEFWMYCNTKGKKNNNTGNDYSQTILYGGGSLEIRTSLTFGTGTNTFELKLYLGELGNYTVAGGLNGRVISGLTPNIWYHFALIRTGNSWKVFLNGENTYTFSSSINLNSYSSWLIGSDGGYRHFNGFIDEFRIINSSSVYTVTNNSITIPTQEVLPPFVPYAPSTQQLSVNANENFSLFPVIYRESSGSFSLNNSIDGVGINEETGELSGKITEHIPREAVLTYIFSDGTYEVYIDIELSIRLPFNLTQGPVLPFTDQISTNNNILYVKATNLFLINAKGKFYVYNPATNNLERKNYSAFNGYRLENSELYTWAASNDAVFISVRTNDIYEPTGAYTLFVGNTSLTTFSAGNLGLGGNGPYDLANMDPYSDDVFFKSDTETALGHFLGDSDWEFTDYYAPNYTYYKDYANKQFVKKGAQGINRQAITFQTDSRHYRFLNDFSDLANSNNNWWITGAAKEYLYQNKYYHHFIPVYTTGQVSLLNGDIVDSKADIASYGGSYLVFLNNETDDSLTELNTNIAKIYGHNQNDSNLEVKSTLPFVEGSTTRRYRPISGEVIRSPYEPNKFNLTLLADGGSTLSNNMSILSGDFEVSETFIFRRINPNYFIGAYYFIGTYYPKFIVIGETIGCILPGAGGTLSVAAFIYTTNGYEWKTSTIPSATWKAIGYGNGVVIICATISVGSTFLKSTNNGLTWTTVSFSIPQGLTGTYSINDIAYAAGRWIIVTSTPGYTFTSTDNGATWSRLTGLNAALYVFNKIVYVNNRWILLTEAQVSNSYICHTSTDGVNWTQVSSAAGTNLSWSNVVWNGMYMFYTYNSPAILTTFDFSSFTKTTTPVVFSNIITNYLGEHLAFQAGSTSNNYYRSTDNGLTWVATSYTVNNTTLSVSCYKNCVVQTASGNIFIFPNNTIFVSIGILQTYISPFEMKHVRTLPFRAAPTTGFSLGKNALSPIQINNSDLVIMTGEEGPQIIKYYPFGQNTITSLRFNSLDMARDGSAFPKKIIINGYNQPSDSGVFGRALEWTDTSSRNLTIAKKSSASNFYTFDYVSDVFFDKPFTIEGWFYFTNLTDSSEYSLISIDDSNYRIKLSIKTATTGQTITQSGAVFLNVETNGTQIYNNVRFTSPGTASTYLNKWTHFALVRSASGYFNIFIDGILQTTIAPTSTTYSFPIELNINIGGAQKVSDIRIVKEELYISSAVSGMALPSFCGELDFKYSEFKTNYDLDQDISKTLNTVGDLTDIEPVLTIVQPDLSPGFTVFDITNNSTSTPTIVFNAESNVERILTFTIETINKTIQLYLNSNKVALDTTQELVDGLAATPNRIITKTYSKDDVFSIPVVFKNTNSYVDLRPVQNIDGVISPYESFYLMGVNSGSVEGKALIITGSTKTLDYKLLFKSYTGEKLTKTTTKVINLKLTTNLRIGLPDLQDLTNLINTQITPFTIDMQGDPETYGSYMDIGGLPPGINFNLIDVYGNGTTTQAYIYGTPEEMGEYLVTVYAYDLEDSETSESFIWTIHPGFKFTGLDDLTINQYVSSVIPVNITRIIPNISVQIAISGFPPTFTYDSLLGRITGSTTSYGVFPCTVTGTTSVGQLSKTFNLTVNRYFDVQVPQDLTLAKGVPINPIVLQFIGNINDLQSISVTGLPQGLSFENTPNLKRIVGTPTQTIYQTIVSITISTTWGETKVRNFRLGVNLDISLGIEGETIEVNVNENILFLELTTVGDTPCTQIEYVSGLPEGFDFSTNPPGISGLALRLGTFYPSFRLYNGSEYTNSQFTLKVNFDLTITPITNKVYIYGDTITPINITVGGTNPISNVVVTGLSGSGLSLSNSNGNYTITGTTQKSGVYAVTVRVYSGAYFVSTNFEVRIKSNFDILIPDVIGNKATFIGYASGGVLSVTSVLSGVISLGMTFNASGVSGEIKILAYQSGTGNTGSYTLDTPSSFTSQTITGTAPTLSRFTSINVPITLSGDIVTINWTNLPQGITYNEGTKTLEGTALQTGSYYTTVTIQGSQGNLTKPDYSTFTINGSVSGNILTVTSTAQELKINTGIAGSGISAGTKIVQVNQDGTFTLNNSQGNIPSITLTGTPPPLFTIISGSSDFYIVPGQIITGIGRKVTGFRPALVPNNLVTNWLAPTIYPGESIIMPPGLQQDLITGEISGISSIEGQGHFTVTACINSYCVSEKISWSLTFRKIELLEQTINIVRNSVVDIQILATRDTPASWTITGTLPTGILFNPQTGKLSGITTAANGVYPVTIKALHVDSYFDSDPRLYNVNLGVGFISISDSITLGGAINTLITADIAAEGEIPTLWEIMPGGTPGPFIVDEIGTVKGTSSTTGTFRFDVRARAGTLLSNLCNVVIDVTADGGGGTTGEDPIFQNTTFNVKTNEVFSLFVSNTGGAIDNITQTGAITGVTITKSGSDVLCTGSITVIGTYVTTITAYGATPAEGSNGIVTFTITFNVTNGNPIILPGQIFTFNKNSTLMGTSRLLMSGEPATAVTFDSLPSGISFDNSNYTFIGQVSSTTGEFSKYATATNSYGSSGAVLVKFVIKDLPITIPSGQIFKVIKGESFTKTIAFSGDIILNGSIATGLTGVSLVIEGTPLVPKLVGTVNTIGSYSIEVTLTNFGNTTKQTVRLDVSDILPIITQNQTFTGTVNETFDNNIAYTGGVPTSWGFTQASQIPTGITFNTATGRISGIPKIAGSYVINVYAENSFGRSQTVPVTINIALGILPPAISEDQEFILSTGNVVNGINIVNVGGVVDSWSASGLPKNLLISQNTGIVSGSLIESAGTITALVTATNKAGTDSKNVTFIITSNLTPPVIQANQEFTFNLNQNIPVDTKLSFSGSSPIFSMSGQPAGVSLTSAGVLQGKPSVLGVFNPTITATNNVGTDTKTIKITVVTDLLPPVLQQNLSPITLTKDITITPYVFSNTGGAITDWDAKNLPDGLFFSSVLGAIIGRPTSIQSKTSTIIASNLAGSSSTTLEISVVSPVTPPVINDQSISVDINRFFNFQLVATGSVTNWSAITSLPGGITLNSTSGIISGTGVTKGVSTFTIKATNEAGSDTATITLTINDNTLKPVITPGQKISGIKGVTVSYRLLYSLAGGIPVSWRLADGYSLHPGLTLDAQNGTISGVPTVATNTTTQLIATNSAGNSTAESLNIQIIESINAPSILDSQTFRATVNTPYSKSILLSAGTATEWRIVSGDLPEGLTLNGVTGVISGTPITYTTNRTIRIFAGNATGGDEKNITVGVLELPISISNQVFYGYAMDPFEGKLKFSGNPVSWQLTNFASGLQLSVSTSGVITGTPSISGEYTGSVTATGVSGISSSATIKIILQSKIPKIVPNQSISTTTSKYVYYNIAYTTVGGALPTKWAAMTALPQGLTLDPINGIIQGTPTGTTSLSGLVCEIKVENNIYGASTEKITIAVAGADTILKITPSQKITIARGSNIAFTPDYIGIPTRWFISLLPANCQNVSINQNTGLITGVINVAGNYEICVHCENAKFDASAFISIKVT